MDLLVSRTNSISIGPKVWVQGDHLYARTPYPWQALTLFAFARQVHLDRERRLIAIEDVRLWFLRRSVVIPFERVAYIDPRYGDFGVCGEWAGHGCRARTDKWEKFTVSLALRKPEETVKLFSYVSGGSARRGGLADLLSADGLDGSDNGQRARVRFFVEQLQEFLQVPVGGVMEPVPDARTGVQYECSICKRPSLASRDTCWTCGSPVQAVLPSLDHTEPVKPRAEKGEGALLDLDLIPSEDAFPEETANAHG